ncbi:hypothetical protein [Luedemannella flava]
MTDRQPPDIVRARDLVDDSIREDQLNQPARPSIMEFASAAVAARAVAAALGRGDDPSYVAYLAALSRATGESVAEQRTGVAQLAALTEDPGCGSDAVAALRALIEAPRPGRLCEYALQTARRALADHCPPRPVADAGTGTPGPAPVDAISHLAASADPAAARPRLRDGLRIFVDAARYEPRLFVISVVGGATFSLLGLVVWLVLRDVVDRAWGPALTTGHIDVAAVTSLAALAVFASVGRAIGLFVSRVGAQTMRRRLSDATQRAVVDQYVEAPVAWHEQRHPDDLVATADGAADTSWRPVDPVPIAVGSAVMVVAAILALFYLAWWLAAIGVLLLAGQGILTVAFLRAVDRHADRARSLRAEIIEMTQHESGEPADMIASFGAASGQLSTEMIRVRGLKGAVAPLLAAVPVIGILAAAGIGAWHLQPGAAGAADLVSATVLLAALPAPVLAVGTVMAGLPTGVRALRSVRGVLADADPIRPARIAIGATPTRADLAAQRQGGGVPTVELPDNAGRCDRLDTLADGAALVRRARNAAPHPAGAAPTARTLR